MASTKKADTISVASTHTIKKFELISKYVEAWAEILLNTEACKGIVYIDCMHVTASVYSVTYIECKLFWLRRKRCCRA